VIRRELLRAATNANIWRGRLMEAGKGGKALLGGFLVVISLRVTTGIDKKLETLLVDASPAWLTRLTTAF
jgi:cytochrome c-type biogenesis protein